MFYIEKKFGPDVSFGYCQQVQVDLDHQLYEWNRKPVSQGYLIIHYTHYEVHLPEIYTNQFYVGM